MYQGLSFFFNPKTPHGSQGASHNKSQAKKIDPEARAHHGSQGASAL